MILIDNKKISLSGVGGAPESTTGKRDVPVTGRVVDKAVLHPLFEQILRPQIEATKKGRSVEPTCFKCGRKASEITEYIEVCEKLKETPGQYVRTDEGTYNPKTNNFCCTRCYIDIGEPVRPGGWKAP